MFQKRYSKDMTRDSDWKRGMYIVLMGLWVDSLTLVSPTAWGKRRGFFPGLHLQELRLNDKLCSERGTQRTWPWVESCATVAIENSSDHHGCTEGVATVNPQFCLPKEVLNGL